MSPTRAAALAAGLLLLLALAPADAQQCYERKSGMWPGEVIADPTKSCYWTGPNWNSKVTCGVACGFYIEVSNLKQPPAGPVWVRATASPKDHRLVIPKTPCRGVEDWNRVETTKGGTNCGGEALWDSAFNTLSSTEKGTWAMAINPSARRSRHQLHIHMAPLTPAMNGLLKKLAASGQATNTWLKVVCNSDKNLAPCPSSKFSSKAKCANSNCNVVSSNSNSSVQVMIVPVSDSDRPSAAQPFTKVYGNSVPNGYTTGTSIVVSRPAKGRIAIIRASDRTSECFVTAGDASCYP